MKIVVIGNGYDLNIGLESSFGSFYSASYKTKNGAWDYDRIRKNVWLLLLYFKYIDGTVQGAVSFNSNQLDWMNIEDFICYVLNDERLLYDMEVCFVTKPKMHQPDGKIQSCTRNDQIFELQSLIMSKIDDSGYSDIYELLADDLFAVETDLIHYLDGLDKHLYSTKSTSLMSDLTNDFSKTYGISFNYTKLPAGLYDYNQIHGSLDSDKIIIGVDRTKIKDKYIKKMRFTKSLRKMSFLSNISMLPKKDLVSEIVFFGHSLGSQDYSYFHSLFNYYDIYNSNVKLSFVYADHHYIDKEKTKLDLVKCQKFKEQYIDSVYKLLNDYVDRSLTQKDADSFVTKLQLEGRLIVEELKTYSGYIRWRNK